MLNFRRQIAFDLRRIVKNLTGQDFTFSIEHPKDESHGDYSSNIAMILWANKELRIKNPHNARASRGKQEYKSPFELAQKIVDSIMHNSQFMIHFQKVEAVKPGFINFWISKKYLLSNLEKILGEKKYGSKPQDPNKKVIVEYSSPNIAKPFTVGHLRSTIIGDAIANLLEANGWKVYRDNHLGDWGTQFGKQIYAIKTWGDEKKIEKSQNPVKELVSLYVKFHEEAEKDPALEERGREWFKKLEEGDSEARRLWKKCVDWSLKEFKTIYEKLGAKFTENNGLGFAESFFEDKIQNVLQELNDKKLLKESEGAKLVFFEKDPSAGRRFPEGDSGQSKFPPLMIIKKDGATLYATRDLATDKFRLKEYGRDVVIINEVGIEQTLYFKQLFEVEKMLGWVKEGQRIHIRHGHYRFKDEKMSTRKGNTIWLEDVLEEAISRAYELTRDDTFNVNYLDPKIVKRRMQINKANWLDHMLGVKEAEEVAKQVGIGAIKWNDLKRSSPTDIVFDWDEILNMQGDSGPYIQYTFARTQSVLTKVINNKRKVKISRNEISFARPPLAKLEPEEVAVLRGLNSFPEVVEEAGKKFAPNLLCNYLFDLAQKFNLFYQKHKILESERREFRIQLTATVGQVIKNGLNLLGIPAPEKM